MHAAIFPVCVELSSPPSPSPASAANVTASQSHSLSMKAPANDAFFAKIREQLEERNYTRPELGAGAYGQLEKGGGHRMRR